MQGRRRITLYEQMSVGENGRGLAGLTLEDVLANNKREAAQTQPHQPPRQRTLVDIIREDESTKKDRKTWKAFKDKLRLKRSGSAWTSSVHIPASDILNPIQFNNTNNSRAHSQVSSRSAAPIANPDASTHHMDSRQVEDLNPTDPDSGPTTRPQFPRRVSSCYEPTAGDPTEDKLKPSISCNSSTSLAGRTESNRQERVVTFREPYDSDEGGSSDDEENLAQPSREVRTLSAREAVAAQEAAEAATAAEAAAEAEPVRMSLMDLLEETDWQMGLEGTMYGEYDSDYDDEEEEKEEEATVEHTCCVCMVRHKGAAFIPCGHTFCRMCSRELLVTRGNCPLCNNFIVEILDIF